ncbi:DUF6612 family protein [Planococcus sp. X10-3]|uniref:DUF6612 family protein n=1 Tax=Planococcus sp. X10-3 TaxID=3061240 RepID=UPI003BB13127
MKKWMTYMGAGALAFTLSGCGETAQPADDSGDDNAAGTSDLTLEEVFSRSAEANEGVSSLHADVLTNQFMSMGEAGMEMEMEVDLGMDMTVEPLAFYQTAETSIVSEDIQNDNPMTMEMYYTEEGLFTYEPTMDMWIKMPEDSLVGMGDLMSQDSVDPSEQMDQLHAFQDDFVFEQSTDEYILKLDASGEQFKNLLDEQLEGTLGQMEIEAQRFLEDMTIHSASYEVFIDKETFLTNKMNVKMDIDMNIEGDTMSILSDIQSTYSQYNEIDAIVVPDEVLEQAE